MAGPPPSLTPDDINAAFGSPTTTPTTTAAPPTAMPALSPNDINAAFGAPAGSYATTASGDPTMEQIIAADPRLAQISGQQQINYSAGGFVGNVVHGITGFVGGLANLAGAAIHDVGYTFAHPTNIYRALVHPTHTGGLGGPTTEGGHSELASLLKSAPAALKADYWTRYGGLGGVTALGLTAGAGPIGGGLLAAEPGPIHEALKPIGRGLYVDPVSYALDATVAGDVTGKIAEFGRAGDFLSHMPRTLVSDETAARILGSEGPIYDEAGNLTNPTTAWEPKPLRYVNPLMNESASIQEVPLRSNPVSRLWKRGYYGILTLDPASIAAKFPEASGSASEMVARWRELDAAPSLDAASSEELLSLRDQLGSPTPGTPDRVLLGRAQQAIDASVTTGIPASEWPRIDANIQLANQNGLRVLRPGAVANKLTALNLSNFLTSVQAGIGEKQQAARTLLSQRLGDYRKLDPENFDLGTVHDFMVGNASTTDLPSNGTTPIEHTLPVVDELPPPSVAAGAPSPQYPQYQLEQAMESVFGRERIGGVDVGGRIGDRFSLRSPTEVANEPKMLGQVADMQQAPEQYQAVVQALNGTDLGVLDTTRDPATSQVEFTGAVRLPDASPEEIAAYTQAKSEWIVNQLDPTVPEELKNTPKPTEPGSVVHVSIATPELARAQVAADDILQKVATLEAGAAAARDAAITALAEGDAAGSLTLSEQARATMKNIDAGKTMARSMFDDFRRGVHAAEDGVPHDVNLHAHEGTRPDHYMLVTKPWLESGFGDFQRNMEHAYGPQRVNQFFSMLAHMKGPIEEIMGTSKNNAAAYPRLIHLLEQWGLPEPLIQEALGDVPWRANAAIGTEKMIARLRNTLRDLMVTEGGDGLERGFSEYDWRVMHQERELMGAPTPDYYPMPAENKPSSYMERSTVNTLRETRPSAARTWKGLTYETGNYSKDPLEAMSRAQGIWTAHQGIRDATRMILDRFARPLTEAEVQTWAARSHPGEVLVSLKTIEAQLGLHAAVEMDTIMNMAGGMSRQRGLWDALSGAMGDAVAGGLDGMADDVRVVPKAAWDALQGQARWQIGEGSKGLKVYNSLLGMWKKAVLSLSPTWIVRNNFGNVIFMALDDPGAIRYGIDQKLTAGSERAFRALFGTDVTESVSSGFFSDLANTAQFGPDMTGAARYEQMAQKLTEGIPGRWLSKASGKMYWLNSVMEQADRRGVFINSLERDTVLKNLREFAMNQHASEQAFENIFANGFEEGDLTKAAAGVDKVLGNFRSFSPLEQHVVRQYLFPFYGFYRHALKFLLRFPFEHPIAAKLYTEVNQFIAQQDQWYPGYLQGSIKVGNLGPKSLMLRLGSLDPLQAFGQQGTGSAPIVSSLNPLLKMFIERQTGVDTFTGQAFEDPNNIITAGGQRYQIIRDANGAVIDVKPVTGAIAPGWLQHGASMFPQAQFIPGLATYPKSTMLRLANYAGLPISANDLAKSQYYNQQHYLEALNSAQQLPPPGA